MRADYFAGRLRELRIAAGMTQAQLVDRFRQLAADKGKGKTMTLDGLSRLERGTRSPTWQTVIHLCNAMGVTPNEFTTEPKTREKNKGRPRNQAPPKPD